MDSVLFVAFWLFIITHIDTLVVLTAFCADADYRTGEVVVGHYLGFTGGLLGAVGAAIIAAELLQQWTFMLGVVPLALGLWQLLPEKPVADDGKSPAPSTTRSRVVVVAVAGIGLSGENIAVFVPFFVDLSTLELAVVIVGYLVGAAVVFLAALLLSRSTVVNTLPGWTDRWLVPLVLVILGTYVLVTGWAVVSTDPILNAVNLLAMTSST